MYLDGNQLSGEIPTKIGNLNTLYELKLCVNDLSASDPALAAFTANIHEPDAVWRGFQQSQSTTNTIITPMLPLVERLSFVAESGNAFGSRVKAPKRRGKSVTRQEKSASRSSRVKDVTLEVVPPSRMEASSRFSSCRASTFSSMLSWQMKR